MLPDEWRRWLVVSVSAIAATWLAPSLARGWVLPEHVRISSAAIARLAPTDRDALQRAWSLARGGGGALCTSLTAPFGEAGDRRQCTTFAAFPALAADHSCNPRQLARDVVEAPWMRDVLEVGRETALDLAPTRTSTAARLDALHLQHIDLQLVDAEYLGRAAANHAHFQSERHSTRLEGFTEHALAAGAALNATSLWVAYHVTALALVRRAARAPADHPQRAAWLWRAFVAEAFALHFLEDSFSAGHFVGTWGNDALRKGTHDYYCRHGLIAQTWLSTRCARDRRCTEAEIESTEYVAHGDAFLMTPDLEHASAAEAASLAQLARVWASPDHLPTPDTDPRLVEVVAYESVDVCTATTVPLGLTRYASTPFVLGVLELFPMPARRAPALPRFRDEFGPVVAASLRFDGGAVWQTWEDTPYFDGSMRVGIGGGYAFPSIVDRFSESFISVEAVASAQIRDGNTAIGWGAHLRLPINPALWFVDLGYWLLKGRFDVWDLVRATQTSAGGGITRIERRSVAFGNEGSWQVMLGRDLTLISSWSRELNRTRQSWQLTVPLFEMVFVGQRSDGIATDLVVGDIAFRLETSSQSTFIGVVAGLGGRMRIYP